MKLAGMVARWQCPQACLPDMIWPDVQVNTSATIYHTNFLELIRGGTAGAAWMCWPLPPPPPPTEGYFFSNCALVCGLDKTHFKDFKNPKILTTCDRLLFLLWFLFWPQMNFCNNSLMSPLLTKSRLFEE